MKVIQGLPVPFVKILQFQKKVAVAGMKTPMALEFVGNGTHFCLAFVRDIGELLGLEKQDVTRNVESWNR